jgi:hypothetical protein
MPDNQTAWLLKVALLYRWRHLGFQRAIIDAAQGELFSHE